MLADKFVTQIRLRKWVCYSSTCSFVFYTYECNDALCPLCGNHAVKCEEVDFLIRNEAFEHLMANIIDQECNEGCWVYQEGVTADNVEEVEAVVGECAIAMLRKTLYGSGCPARYSVS